MARASMHGHWSSRIAFVLAATGSAVGLGNVWKFPYMAGENGGGAFVLVYLLCVLVIGWPVMMAEVMLGRRGRHSPVNTMRILCEEERSSRFWTLIGWAGIVAGFLILSYYSVIAGWTLAYTVRAAVGVFDGITPEGVAEVFGALVADPERLLAWHTLFMALTMVVVARGVEHGLERAVRFLMPALFLLLLLLVGYAMAQGQFGRAVAFLFRPDFSKLTGEAVLAAMGQAFFSLSLGMGAIMMYGSYLPQHASIPRTTFTVAMSDTLVALLAGLAIFPIVFGEGLAPDQGPSLIFKTLALAFGHMPAGAFFGSLFFLLLVFAAWTSAISLIEPAVAWLVENRSMRRVEAAVWAGTVAWLLGIGTILSFNAWSEITLWGRTFFDLLDYLTSNIMLPLGGLAIALFAAWVMREASLREEIELAGGPFRLWHVVLRYVAPAGIVLVFLNVIGVFG